MFSIDTSSLVSVIAPVSKLRLSDAGGGGKSSRGEESSSQVCGADCICSESSGTVSQLIVFQASKLVRKSSVEIGGNCDPS